MKRSFNIKKRIGRKNLILCVVALVLVMLTTVGATYSWIEEVSKVEFNSDTGQETPYKIRGKVLKDTANIVQNDVEGGIKLEDYFNEGGEMHLSPCYSDGETFYFPKENSTRSGDNFRLGTKDDANVNYLQATFRVSSPTANTSYWLQRYDSATRYFNLQDGTGTNDSKDINPFHDINSSGTDSYMRMSVTVDGATSVYAYNANGKYKKINNGAVITEQGRCVETYAYYDISNADKTYNNTDTQTTGAGLNQNKTNDNLYCNTLFTVPKGQTKVVTIKIWFEYNNGNVKSYDLSNINFQLTSSWAKTRRIYVIDRTLALEGYDSAQWLTTHSAKLYWGLKDDLSTKYQMTADGTTTDGYKKYYCDIPAVYNGAGAVFFRCDSSGSGGVTYTSNGKSQGCWNYWETAFPDTFHNETYSVYTEDFGTWDDDSEVNGVYFVNSTFFTNVYDYMWDSASVHGTGINDKVVKNADWPGVKLKSKMKTKTSSQSLDAHAFLYNSDYDRVIFNDGDLVTGQNQEYQTQDLWLTNEQGQSIGLEDGTFDMATLTWFHTNPSKSDWSTKMPSYSNSNTYLYSNISTNNAWKKTRFAYGGEYSGRSGNAFNGTSSSNMVCKLYCKAAGNYECKLCYNNTWYGAYKDADKRLNVGGSYTLGSDNNHQENVILTGLKAKTVYRIYFSWDNGNPRLSLAEGEANT